MSASNMGGTNSKPMPPAMDITGQLGEKGLLNSTGLHHCFLNVCIQSLWHIESFRERFIRLPHHHLKSNGLLHDYIAVQGEEKVDDEGEIIHHSDAVEPIPNAAASSSSVVSTTPLLDASLLDDPRACVCCALKTVFVNYEHSDSAILPPDVLRFALSTLLDNQGGHKYRLNEMSDAEEALDEILKYLHLDDVQLKNGANAIPPPTTKNGSVSDESLVSRSLDVICTPPCISHTVFGAQLMDQKNCQNCRASSDPEINATFLYRIYVDEITKLKKLHKDWTLESILKANYLSIDYSCPSPEKTTKGAQGQPVKSLCKGKAKVERWLLSKPEVFSMMVVWSSPEPERSEISDFFNCIPQQLHLEQFLQVHSAGSVSEVSRHASSEAVAFSYKFRGMILFYGRHYVAIFYSAQFQAFVMFDDRRVTRVGDWKDVVERCVRGKLMPTILMYESNDPTAKQRLNVELKQFDDAARIAEEKAMLESQQGTDTGTTVGVSSNAPVNLSHVQLQMPVSPLIVPSPVLAPTPIATVAPRIPPRPSVPPVPLVPSSTSSSSSTDLRVHRQPPAIIPDYIPSNGQPDARGIEPWWSPIDQAAEATPPLSRAESFGYATPRSDTLRRPNGPPTTWICLGCNSLWSMKHIAPPCPKCQPNQQNQANVGTTIRQ